MGRSSADRVQTERGQNLGHTLLLQSVGGMLWGPRSANSTKEAEFSQAHGGLIQEAHKAYWCWEARGMLITRAVGEVLTGTDICL